MVMKASQKACNQMASVNENDTKPMAIDAMLIEGKAGIVFVGRETHVRQCVGYRSWRRGFLNECGEKVNKGLRMKIKFL